MKTKRSDLPPRQTRILTLVADAEEQGRQPSRAEVATAMGYAFPSAVSKHVDALVRKGHLVAEHDKKRNVRLTEIGWAAIGRTPASKGVPVIGAIAAGTPITASENLETFLDDLAPAPGRFALRVRGDSMVNAGILDGDFAIIERGQPVGEGMIGAVRVGDEATLKRLHFLPDAMHLISENPAYPVRIVNRRTSESEGIEIIGPLRYVYRSFIG
jgi:repressor LexA